NSATQEEINFVAKQCHTTLSQLGSGWMLHADLIRKESSDYVAQGSCYFNDTVRELIDCERREYYLNANQHYESTYTWVFTYRPPAEIKARFTSLFVSKK